ncbi:cobalamin biosynthesis protein [Sagittula sp. NFXS13]|uniref:Cobalt-precorrin 5A hydrolase n=1 Tax=Sagittula marina TaxID=943940 RepID=A0A7W6GSU8_9RHOB|nr:cobalamin biosynthesis protein [Sagittula marina]MBB3985938.1 cobalt-precorrin 5A hydrolase [Sagittula marina]
MIVAGFGCHDGASVASLGNAYRRARLGQDAVVLATIEEGLTLLQQLSHEMQTPAVSVSDKYMSLQETKTQSEAALMARGVGSVAEAAALAAAGPGARLLSTRVMSEDGCATCAFAIGEEE